MIRKSTFSAFLALTLALVMCSGAAAQWTQQKACPGWSNPANFNAWTNGQLGSGGYSGSGGVKNSSSCPNVMTEATGAQSLGPAYTAAQMNTVEASGCYQASLPIPDQTRQFAIMTNTTGTDPNTGNHLKYVPTQFNYIDTTGRPTLRSARVYVSVMVAQMAAIMEYLFSTIRCVSLLRMLCCSSITLLLQWRRHMASQVTLPLSLG